MDSIRSHIAEIALGLLLIILGHDALMAADPHHAADAGHAGHHEAPAPANQTECGPTTGMHAKPSNTLDVDHSATSGSLPQATEEFTGFVPHWSVEPDHPPDIKRALLQVYRN